jgi:hypothetical protein
MPGHNPHRPEGKIGDMEHARRASVQDEQAAADQTQAPPPPQYPAEEQIGGSRPGVPSRVKNAIARREDDDTG